MPVVSKAESLANLLADSLGVERSLIHIASLPRRDYLFPEKLRPTLPTEWLAAKTHTTVADASIALSSLPVHVPNHFPQMPLGPLRFLSFLAALHGNPQILIYESGGMHARDRYLLHKFAKAHYPEGALVHCWFGENIACQFVPSCNELDLRDG